METISIKLEKRMLQQMEKTMKQEHYATKTEFIREAIREKITTKDQKAALAWLEKVAGSGGRRIITDEEYKQAGEKAFVAIEKKLKTQNRV